MNLNARILREYDIRGHAERDLTTDVAEALGHAYASGVYNGKDPVVLGRDCRHSSPRLREAFASGITASGAPVVDIGVVPTPVLYFAAFHIPCSGAVIITGSHNPSEDNGFKLLKGRSALHGDSIRDLGRRIREDDLNRAPTRGSIREQDVTEAYLEHATKMLRLGPRRMKIVVDGGNGAGGPTAVSLYQRLGFDVVPLYCEMDGSFPNHHPDPTVEGNLSDLKERVVSTGAELGIALDGDGDRIGAVDGRGRVLWGDQLMILFGRAILSEVPGARIIAEVKCSQALFDELERAGGKPEMWKVGHSLIKARMREVKAELGGEMSGHIFFAHRYLGFDDAIYSGARLLELLSNGDSSLSDLRDTLPDMVNTPEIRIPCPDDEKFDVVSRAAGLLDGHGEVSGVSKIDGARANFGDGWGLVRASNTQPALVMRCEANSAARLDVIRQTMEQVIQTARSPSNE